MTVIEFMAELHRLGVGLRLDHGQITVQAPRGVLTEQLRSRLRDHRDELIAVLADAEPADAVPLQPAPRDRPIAVSYAQQRLWFLDRLQPGSAQYNVPIAIRLGGPVDETALRAALDGLVARHEPLRTTFTAPDGVPVQIIHPTGPAYWRHSDVRAADDPLRETTALIAADAAMPFDLEHGPLLRARLIRLAELDHVLALVMHHIVCDEWSTGILQRDLAALYAAQLTGTPPPLAPLRVQYGDYAAWQRQSLVGRHRDRLLSHWRDALAGLIPTQLPTDRPRNDTAAAHGAVVEFTIPTDVAAGIRALGRQNGTTVFMTLLAGFHALLARYTDRTDIAVGTPVAGRDRVDLEPLVGFFINTLVLRADLTDDPTFAAILYRTRAGALAAYAHQDLPFELLVEDLSPDRTPGAQPLFSMMFRLEHDREPITLDRLDACELPVEQRTAKFDLTVALTEGPGGLWGGAEYATDLFDRRTIETLLRSYVALLSAAVRDSQTRLSQLPLLDDRMRAELERHSTGPAPHDPWRAVPDLIRQQATERPDAVAVVTGDTELTYGALIVRADELAARLRCTGVGPETVVAVCLPRTADLVVGLLAVQLAGGAYLPVDPRQPAARLRRLVTDAGPHLLLAHPSTAGPFTDLPLQVLDVAAHPATAPAAAAPTAVHAGQAAYVIYTSGSTGEPKAVVVSHRALANLIAAFAEGSPVAAGQTLMAVTTVSFDIAALELFLPLAVGGAVVIATDDDTRDPHESLRRLDRPDLRLVQATPAWWRMVLDAGWTGRTDLTVWCGGEALPGGLARRLRAVTAGVHNLYGPTETTIWSTRHPVSAADGPGTTPIGTPIPGTTCHVVDGAGRPVPPGVVGELLIGGIGLARGYRNRPDLTAERFVADPFRRDGSRLYRTGDRVRRRPDGVLQFIGRADDQLKIRGHRVEPAEVEAVLAQHDGVAASAVTAHTGPDGTARLTAHVVARTGALDDRTAETPAAPATEHLDQWRQVWETAVDPAVADPAFDIAGWVASDTGAPIPAEHMREWVETTVARIRRLRPRRILELGCGTGLLLWRLAPDCVEYTATDFAAAPLTALAQRLPSPLSERVRLLHREAVDLDGLEPGRYDVVVVNSVVQYFPNVEHLRRVLAAALRLVRPGGQVFLGDLRSLPLQRGETAAEERELLLDPRIFQPLRRQLPQVTHVQVMPKAGRHHNEMTRYRYDAILYTAPVRLVEPVQWRHWVGDTLSLNRLEQLLAARTAALGITDVPNARLTGTPKPADHASAGGGPGHAVEPDDLVDLSVRLGLAVELSWAAGRADGSFDVVFYPWPTGSDAEGGELGSATVARFGEPEPGPAGSLTNDPFAAARRAATRRRLATSVRALAAERLPDYLVPGVVQVVDALPLTANGKVDRRALPDVAMPPRRAGSEAPATDTERAVAGIWCEVLGVGQIGRDDDFFALGGHSLLATQVISRLATRLGAEVPLRAFFAGPTLRRVAGLVDAAGRTATFARIERAPRGEPVPLSFAQQRVWFLAQLRPESTEYNVTVASRLRGELDAASLRRALDQLVVRHEILRTTFPAVDGIPAQQIHDPRPVSLPLLDVTPDDAREIVDAAALEPFDLATGPLLRARLLRLHPTEHVLLLATHHIVCDDWSVQLLARELSSLYERSHPDGPGEEPAPLPVQYADFAVWQRRRLSSERLDRQLAYWRGQLAELAHLELPTDRPHPVVRDSAAGWVEFTVPARVRHQLEHLARSHDATMFMVVVAAFASLLHRETGATDIPIGTPIAGRTHPDLEPLIGLFVNTLVLRLDVSAAPSFGDLLDRVRDTALAAYTHEDVPFEQLVEHLAAHRDRSRHPLFQVLVNYTVDEPDVDEHTGGEEAAQSRSAADTLEADPFGGPPPTGKFDLRLVVRDGGAGLRAALQYRTDIFERATATRMADRLGALLDAVATDPRRPIDLVPLLAEPERQSLAAWATGEAQPVGPTLPVVFEEQVRRAPDRTAAVDHQRRLTYQQLDEAVTRLAASLVDAGAGADTVVGLLVPHTVDLLIGVLATWRAGAAYLALNPADPMPRVTTQLRAAAVALVVTADALHDAVPDLPIVVLPVYPDSPPQHTAVPPPPHLDQLAYVVFTSGSTGEPKPVAVTHRGLANYTAAVAARLAPPPGRSWALAQPLSVDLAVTSLCLALGTGGTVHLPRPAHLVEDLAALRPDYLKLTPTHLRLLLQLPDSLTRLPRRALILGGEPTPQALLTALAGSGWTGQLFGHYGPAETTIGATMSTPDDDRHLLLGTPLANVTCHVLDAAGQPVPPGVYGELHLAGPGLARGYLGRPDLTAERFVADPSAGDGARVYRTGDRVRWQRTGVLQFAGRVDEQLNLNGFRVEPGEVSAVLTTHPQVVAATVDLRTDFSGTPRLVAWLAPAVPDGVRRWLTARVPSHLVPAEFVSIPAMPLTTSGKIDRRALPEPAAHQPSAGETPPANATEWTLAALWSQALGVEAVNREDDFFDLGGHSLLAAQVLARIPALFGVDLPLTALFDHPTLAALALCVDAAQAAPRPAAATASPLVVLNRRPERPRLFCVHPLSGSTFCFRPIAAGLGEHVEFVGVQARGLAGDEEPFERIDHMAAHYVSAIRQVQPEGPYLIAGWSFGSMVALEAAQQLVSSGQRVDFLGLIGPTNVHRRHGSPEVAAKNVGRLRILVDQLVAGGARSREDLALTIYPLVCEPDFAGDPAQYDRDLLFRRLRVLAAHRGAAARYRPRPYPGACTLIMPEVRHADDAAVLQQWQRLARGGVTLASAPGDHLTMVMDPANAWHIARLLRTLLTGAR